MIRECPVCHHVEDNIIVGLLPSNVTNIWEHYSLAECIRCETMYISPLPSEQAFRHMYQTFDQFSEDEAYQGQRAQGAVTYYAQCLNKMIHHLDLGHKVIRLLDVGAGLSFVSKAAKTLENKVQTVAQDLSTCALEYTGHYVDSYYTGTLQDCLPSLVTAGPYHIITLTHVIEHVTDPCEMMRDLVRLLANPGLIFITTPHRPPNWHKNHKNISRWRLWSYNHTPPHLQYFNRSSIKQVAENVDCQVVSFSDSEDEGQALEAWLAVKK